MTAQGDLSPDNKSQVKSRTASSVHDVKAENPPFGSRFLTDDADVWSQNAWDHVPPPNDQGEIIASALAKQRNAPVPENEKQKYYEKPARHWDNFYKMNSSNFFRDRKWYLRLHLEFPELVEAAEPEAGAVTIAEIGCGAGNAVFPLLSANKNPQLSLRAYDYSSHAIKLVQTNPLYAAPPVGSIHAAVWDLTSSELPPGTDVESVDIIVLIFVFSALQPAEWRKAVTNIHKILKPGGLLLFRDYGRHDLAQLRFKSGRLLEDNFYIRGDKTRVYFFELDELALLFTGAPAPAASRSEKEVTIVEETDEGAAERSQSSAQIQRLSSASPAPSPDDSGAAVPTLDIKETLLSPSPTSTQIHPSLLESFSPGIGLAHPLFAIQQLGVDRRLIVNRKRQLKMYRVWMQAKLRKLVPSGQA
ncbi:methyltransferase [Laetiporus sulphureus 93-53]|uniref:tRNA N(3)-methylcytidine methyltransferase n=1 Tax=Laetiporus sulphureus 93-53 TaxID=1314785 RepID=A0A165B9V3_9APHY|nr:methyltransferase [Laetiporus sulphureus 93-53]KZT00582.1 methyltransferase [Laetiporus sulphureus 93-53]